MTASSTPRYVVVSPVKDEAGYVEHTLQSMVTQTVKPIAWVIVDDGSKDDTAQIVRRYVARHSFIILVPHPNAGARLLGSAEVHAFNYGCQSLSATPYDFIVKLDCDLSFEPDYFEKLLERFAEDPDLGIASGVYLEINSGVWTTVSMPWYHAFGASKMVRRACFEQFGGFPPTPGWDTVDEIWALSRGWRTRHFHDLQVRHHKREGSALGQLKTSRMHGEIFYKTGGDPLFLVLKVLHRTTSKPLVVSAAALTFGYVAAMVRRTPRLVSRAEAKLYRRLLRKRLLGGETPLLHPLGR